MADVKQKRESTEQYIARLEMDRASMLVALEDIADSPCSMVNDSESIRASFNRLGRVARAAMAKVKTKGEA